MKSLMVGICAVVVSACGTADSENAANDTGAIMGNNGGESIPPKKKDASVFRWTRIYCTPDNESHIETRSVILNKTNFAPPASPLFIGGGGPATRTFFAGFEPNWGGGDLETGTNHPTPAVQWITILTGNVYMRTTDGHARVIRSGDVLHLEDAAPCKGHISHNTTGEAVFAQFVR